ncbi:hypothetical protein [Nitrosomonas halophila]|uniref:hypothetical protein n=1 Tax=Nitrosomonas halophila TaxID=44576 RepID=UPI001FDF5A85|nr:hypothetical protein [Nitrosomonas halophila]
MRALVLPSAALVPLPRLVLRELPFRVFFFFAEVPTVFLSACSVTFAFTMPDTHQVRGQVKPRTFDYTKFIAICRTSTLLASWIDAINLSATHSFPALNNPGQLEFTQPCAF